MTTIYLWMRWGWAHKGRIYLSFPAAILHETNRLTCQQNLTANTGLNSGNFAFLASLSIFKHFHLRPITRWGGEEVRRADSGHLVRNLCKYLGCLTWALLRRRMRGTASAGELWYWLCYADNCAGRDERTQEFRATNVSDTETDLLPTDRYFLWTLHFNINPFLLKPLHEITLHVEKSDRANHL